MNDANSLIVSIQILPYDFILDYYTFLDFPLKIRRQWEIAALYWAAQGGCFPQPLCFKWTKAILYSSLILFRINTISDWFVSFFKKSKIQSALRL